MNPIRNFFLVAALAAVLPAAHAEVDAAAQALAQKHMCLGCHKVDAKLVGPAYIEVAKKYQGMADAPAKLAAKVRKGGKGVWGPMAMPPAAAAVSDDDIKTIVAWILSLAPAK